ncbi:MAG: sulfur carrier protein ThiS [Bacteroidaceae bacterium]|jgi:sulfur carrier protein|nr:sulfur carrier protein ThiS [Bacteroidaceae bacterium]
MKIRINNSERETQAATLQQLAQELNLPAKGVALAMTNRMVPRTEWADTPVTEGCDIVIIKAVCGG